MQMESMRKVLVYDSEHDSWYGQATTAEGDEFPDGRVNFCAVAASAPDNSSHNIYVYAGEAPNAQPDAFSDTWILSVPSFRWMRVDVASAPRKSHACTTLAGNRYMLSYGGVPVGWGEVGDDDQCYNEVNHGMRLFDLSTLASTPRYEGPPSAGGPTYTVPSLVYAAIGGDGQGGATQTAPAAGFETPSLAELFRTSQSSRGPTPPDPSASTGKMSNNTAAIAGGVVGGVAAIALAVLAVFCLLRWNRRNKERAGVYEPAMVSSPYEADGQVRSELVGSGYRDDAKRGASHVYAAHSEAPIEMEAGYVASSMPSSEVQHGR
jgi:hypothetical protein